MVIRNSKISDIDYIVDIHLSAFKDFFLSSLGSSFLKTFYKSIILDKNSICIVIEDDNIIQGFCFGTLKSKNFYKNLIIKNIINYLIIGIKVFFKNPLYILRIFLNIKRTKNKIDDGKYSEILSIAVNPRKSKKGFGGLLLNEFEKIVKYKNLNRVSLTTNFDDNKKILKFYKRNGYKVFYQFTTYPNRKMYKLIKDFR